jgi:DNA-binding NtrC family response regulator
VIPPQPEYDGEATVEAHRDSARGALQRVEVSAVVLSGASKGERFPLAGRMTIGKAKENTLVLTDETISRQHCEIERRGAQLHVKDLGSLNGVFVESARIQQAVIPVGSVIRLGEVEIAFRPNLQVLDLEPIEGTEFEGAVAESAAMRRIFRMLAAIAKTDATVLLEGETGTGKEVLARALARASARAEPFVVLDCGAVTYSLLESELFGHERGAFTGAVAARRGAFERAAGGTLFLDEIGELPIDVQPKLLRVLESREFRRVGGNEEIRADVRIVAATRRDLTREVAAGKFREDLYFRLAVVPVKIPPLRARREDIPRLVRHVLASVPGGEKLAVGATTMEWLAHHDWPGNVRELRNLLERAVYVSTATGHADLRLPGILSGSGDDADVFRFSLEEKYKDARARYDGEFERRYVRWLLDAHGDNLSAAARAVQIDRKYLHQLAKKHGFRSGSE